MLLANIMVADPLHLALTNHVPRPIARDRSPRCSEFARALFGPNASFDRAVILLQNGVQILDWAVAARAAQCSRLFYPAITAQ